MAAQDENLSYGPDAVLMKGGHFEGEHSPDLLVTEADDVWFEANRIDSMNTHGTGCSLSSALAAGLARGMSMIAATQAAKSFITEAIEHADRLEVGSGHGPTHHFHAIWNEVNE